jgi:hypothetical protein
MNNLCSLPNDKPSPETDVLLHDYFQAELPHAWPTFKTPKPARMKQRASFWSRYSGRLALAACVALLVAGYLTLGGFFPPLQTPAGLEHVAPPIGMKDPKTNAPAPRNNHAEEPIRMPTPMDLETTKNEAK